MRPDRLVKLFEEADVRRALFFGHPRAVEKVIGLVIELGEPHFQRTVEKQRPLLGRVAEGHLPDQLAHIRFDPVRKLCLGIFEKVMVDQRLREFVPQVRRERWLREDGAGAPGEMGQIGHGGIELPGVVAMRVGNDLEVL